VGAAHDAADVLEPLRFAHLDDHSLHEDGDEICRYSRAADIEVARA
jgi:hypothetical protein